MAQNLSKTTTDHDTIRRWVEERGGSPAEVESTARGDQTGIIRIDFPGYSGEGTLRRIDWDAWFAKFDEAGLAFVYEDETSGGQRSNFNKLVSRETSAARARGVRTSRRGGERRGASRARSARASAARSTSKSSRSKSRSRSGTASRSGGSRTARSGATRRAGARAGTKAATRSSGRRQASRSSAAKRAGRAGGRTTPRKGGGSSRRTSRRSR